MQSILLTGAAGFIGWMTSWLLLKAGYQVVGIDNMNSYYDVKVKTYRLNTLKEHKDFTACQTDIRDMESLENIFREQGWTQ